jgi:hypothetical protein
MNFIDKLIEKFSRPDYRILICIAFGTARIYSWSVKDGVECDFVYTHGDIKIADNFQEFIKYIDVETNATNMIEFISEGEG